MLEFLEPHLVLSISSNFDRLPFAFLLSRTACRRSKLDEQSNCDETRISHKGLPNGLLAIPIRVRS